MDPRYAVVVRAAASVHAVVTRRQLRHLGVGERMIDRWIAAGLLHRVHRGVYAVGRPDLTANGHRMAAVRALGSQAALSHGSAAALWEITNTGLFPLHVTAPGSGRRQRPGSRLRLHRATTLHPDDVTTRLSIPVTSVARTCLDHAGQSHVTVPRLVQVVEQSQREQVFDLNAFTAVISRNPKHPGVAKLAAALPYLEDEPPDIASRLEAAFYEFVDTYLLPRPLGNVWVGGHKVDAHWPQWNLVVELKSRRFHLTPKAFERDAVRDADLQRAGQRVIQVTWKRVTTQPQALHDHITGLARLS
jgi:hypothetical protein